MDGGSNGLGLMISSLWKGKTMMLQSSKKKMIACYLMFKWRDRLRNVAESIALAARSYVIGGSCDL